MVDEGGLTRKLTLDEFVTEKIDVIKNNLLGSYDEQGNYFLSRPVIEELLKLTKVKKSSFGNSIFCVGTLLGYGEIVFEVSFNNKTNDGKNAKATLYVLEGVDKINGYLQNTLKTKLAEYVSDVSHFMEEAYKYFRVSLKPLEVDDDDDADEGRERKVTEDDKLDESFILAKKQFSRLLDKLLDDKFLDAYGKYFSFRLSALTKLNNEFSTTILDNFNSNYKLIENTFLQEKNYKMLNELLDKCIEEVSGTNEKFIAQEKEFNDKTQPALDAFIDSYNKLSGKFESRALNMMEKSDRVKVKEMIDKDAKVTTDTPTQDYENMRESIDEVVQQEKENTAKSTDIVSEIRSNVEGRQTPNTTTSREPQSVGKEEQAPQSQQSNNDHQGSVVENYMAQKSASRESADAQPIGMGQTTSQSLKDRLSRINRYKQSEEMQQSDADVRSEVEARSEREEKSPESTDEKMGSIFDFFSQKRPEREEQLSRNFSDRYNEFTNDASENNSNDMEEYLRRKNLQENRNKDYRDFDRDM